MLIKMIYEGRSLAEGGQTTAHGVRMLRQVVKIAIYGKFHRCIDSRALFGLFPSGGLELLS